MVVNTSLSIITLNVVELNTPIKRHRVEDQIKEQKQNRNLLILSVREPLQGKGLKVKEWKKIVYASKSDKKVGVAMLYNRKQTLKQRP